MFVDYKYFFKNRCYVCSLNLSSMLFVVYLIVLIFVFTNDIELSFIERSCALNKTNVLIILSYELKRLATRTPPKLSPGEL